MNESNRKRKGIENLLSKDFVKMGRRKDFGAFRSAADEMLDDSTE